IGLRARGDDLLILRQTVPARKPPAAGRMGACAMVVKGLLAAIAKGLGGCILGGWLLWQIAVHAGPQTGEGIVHVTEYPVVVMIGGRSYSVSTWRGSPVVCELGMGWHELRMWRGDRLVYQEAFQVRPGEDIVLTAWAPRLR